MLAKEFPQKQSEKLHQSVYIYIYIVYIYYVIRTVALILTDHVILLLIILLIVRTTLGSSSM